MSDNKFNLDLEYNQDFLAIDMEDQGIMELSDQEEEQPVDSMGPLVCGEDLFSDSQLVDQVNNPTQDPVLCPARDAETERILQPEDFSWAEDVKAQDAALLELSSEEQQGPGAQSLFHLPVEISKQEVSRDGVKLSSNHSDPDSIQDIVLEAQLRASFQSTLDRLSGLGTRPQGESTRALRFVREGMLRE